jgi:hypothetical protein
MYRPEVTREDYQYYDNELNRLHEEIHFLHEEQGDIWNYIYSLEDQ